MQVNKHESGGGGARFADESPQGHAHIQHALGIQNHICYVFPSEPRVDSIPKLLGTLVRHC